MNTDFIVPLLFYPTETPHNDYCVEVREMPKVAVGASCAQHGVLIWA